jgi:O-antigen/teichoic acid export membrane protein
MKYFKNTSWLFGEKILRMFVGLFISVWIARYLGPEQFGLLNYALAIVSFVGIFVYLGLSGILVHELVDKPEENEKVLGTAFFMKLIGSLVAYMVLIIFAFSTTDFKSINFWLLTIIGLGVFLQPFDVINSFNESQVMAKYSVKAKSYAFIIFTIVKILLILSGASLLFFGAIQPLEALLGTIILFYYFYKQGHSVRKWRFNLKKSKELIGRSWKLILSFVFVTIYLKIDQVMLAWMINDQAVGIYSVAASLSEAWYFVPSAIVASLFPALIKTKKNNFEQYQHQLQKLYDLLFLIALVIAILVSLFANKIILTLYGEAYAQSAIVLMIHVWAGIFIFMRTLFSKWIIMEDLLILSLYTQGFGGILNIILNLFFIPEYGVVGAAIATVLSYAGASYFALFLMDSSRGQAKMMTLSLLLPIRVVMYREKLWSH